MKPLPLLLFLFFAACETTVRSGDDALLRGDYDRAVRLYEQALESSTDRDEMDRTKTKLDAARARAGLAHLSESKRLASENRWDAAFAEAETAVRLRDNELTRQHLDRVRTEYSKQLRTQANAALRDGRTDEAIRILEEAERVEPDPQNQSLLDASRREARAWHNENFAPALALAQEARVARAWEKACVLYEEAHRHGRSTESTKEAGFCARMRDAERAGERRDERQTRLQLESALTYGLDTDWVRQRMEALLPQEWAIVVNSATVLPFDPATRGCWDPDPTSPQAVPGAEEFLGKLASFRNAGAGGLAELVRAVEAMRSGPRDPDCFPVVVTPGQRSGGAAFARPDRLNPIWDFRAVIRGRTTDETDVRVAVFDLDENGREQEIGVWKTTFREILANPGPRVVMLVAEDGSLTAGGMLVLKLTVSRNY